MPQKRRKECPNCHILYVNLGQHKRFCKAQQNNLQQALKDSLAYEEKRPLSITQHAFTLSGEYIPSYLRKAAEELKVLAAKYEEAANAMEGK